MTDEVPRDLAPATRREFLTKAAIGLGGTVLLGRRPMLERRLTTIGIQLYTVRGEMQKSVDSTLERIAAIGYREVEFAGYFGKAPAVIAERLKATGLRAPSAHISLDDIRNRWPQVLDAASTMGHSFLVCAFIDPRERTPDGFKRAADDFNTAGAAAARHQIGFAYHNHEFEFQPISSTDRRLVYDVLLETCDPTLVKMELDLYWMNHGKHDPLLYFGRYPGRFPLVHVKDMNVDGSIADVGAGTLPFARYFAREGQAGIQHYFVERDDPIDAFQSAEASYRYLNRLTY